MKIAIVGAGAIGTFYGVKLAQAGHDVRFLLRSDYEVVRKNGFEVHDCGNVFCVPVNAHKTPESIGVCDLVFVALKTTANAHYSDLIAPLVGAGTRILTVQNGLGNTEKLCELFGTQNVLGGICYATINRTAPGVVKTNGRTLLWIAEPEGLPQERTRELAAMFTSAGLAAEAQDSLAAMLWKKLCWNVPFNGLCIAGGNIDCAQLMASPELIELSWALMRELQAAARAIGVEISDSHLQKQVDVTVKCGAYLPSSLLDFRAGRPVEVESIWGEPLRVARAAGVPVPHLETLYWLLKKLCR